MDPRVPTQAESRLSGDVESEDVALRTPFERDRDRILYSDALARLAGRTQVASVTPDQVTHDRLIHSTKVAQVGRRSAALWLKCTKGLTRDHLDPDVVEAACLAHDLGHPPYAHLGERTLRAFSRAHIAPKYPGWVFEGNAQSFRILTRLEFRAPDKPGLDLTLRTARAVLKYPHAWSPSRSNWGFYPTEASYAASALSYPGSSPLEAEVMDWADDVTYALHDFQDFYRGGLIDLQSLFYTPRGFLAFAGYLADSGKRHLLSAFKIRAGDEVLRASDIWPRATGRSDELLIQARAGTPVSIGVTELASLASSYTGSRSDRAALQSWASRRISAWQDGAEPVQRDGQWRLQVSDPTLHEQEILKELVRYFVIDRPGLRHQQAGQEHVLNVVLGYYLEAAGIVSTDGRPRDISDTSPDRPGGGWRFDPSRQVLARFPQAQQELLRQFEQEARGEAGAGASDDASASEPPPWHAAYRYLAPQVVVDLVAGLSERRVEQLFEVLRCGGLSTLSDAGVG